MPYIEPEVIEQARQIDLLTYLRKFEPDNVEEVKGTRNVYRTVDHDSLKTVSYTHLGAVQKGAPWRSANPDGQYAENGNRDKCAE